MFFKGEPLTVINGKYRNVIARVMPHRAHRGEYGTRHVYFDAGSDVKNPLFALMCRGIF